MDAAETRRDSSIPGRLRGVWNQVAEIVATSSRTAAASRVLDCGGGTGSFAVPLAVTGAEVTVIDISVDALATLERRAAEAGVGARIHGVQADVEALGDAVPSTAFDVVLAHGILEVVDDLGAAMTAMAAALRPGGVLSVLVSNPVASVLARAMAGDLGIALDELRGLHELDSRRGPAAVQAACRTAGLEIQEVHGAGVFTEFVPGASLDLPGAADALADLEAESAARHPFLDIASRVHVLARRPD